jgi:hypothetical protein
MSLKKNSTQLKIKARQDEESSFDDLFDDVAYRVAQTTFCVQSHQLSPQGQTHYRGNVVYAGQGIPTALSTAHQAFVCQTQTPGWVIINPAQKKCHKREQTSRWSTHGSL